MLPLQLLALLLFITEGIELHPHTLVNTAIACITVEDCLVHYKNDWCESTGVKCIHRYCKLIPDFPCKKSTERCVALDKRCEAIQCKVDSDCDNGIYCDGTEVCQIKAAGGGLCVTDPARPNCLYTGGVCNESERLCAQPKVRILWRSKAEQARRASILSISAVETSPGTNTSIITQMQVNLTALIVVAAFVFVILFLFLAYVLSRSIRANRTKKVYT